MSTITYLTTIKHTFYRKINESIYIQKPSYDKVNNWFDYEPKANRNFVNKDCSKIIYHKRLHELFFMLIDPLKTTNDASTDLFDLIEKHKDLLKELTPHHKKLQRDIVMYISNKGEDTSYTNEKCMRFWASLLNSRIVFIERNFYKIYSPSVIDTNTKEFIIGVSEEGFEYIDKTMLDYSKNITIYERIDSTKLHTKSIEELKCLCDVHKIIIPAKIKKSDIVSKLIEVLI